jgi:hypothetical protein
LRRGKIYGREPVICQRCRNRRKDRNRECVYEVVYVSRVLHQTLAGLNVTVSIAQKSGQP